MNRIIKTVSLFVATTLLAQAQAPTPIKVNVAQPVSEIQPTMWGIFFEDINLGADGGIYAELVKNRSFEFQKPLMGWKIERKTFHEGEVLIQNRADKNTANPRFVSVKVENAQKGDLGLTNEGFRGMGIKNGLRYDFSVMYRQSGSPVKVHAELLDAKGQVIGEGTLTPSQTDGQWHRQAVSFNAKATEAKGKLRLWFEGNGQIDLDMISLFPEDTWKGRPGGMRADMIQKLADLKPGFIRFPGGCIVEGFDLNNRYQWKKTIGPIEERQLIMNRWNIEFAHRPAPDYFQTFGLGFFEYLQLAEDIGSEALPILNCGMACQFNSAEVVPMDQLEQYVQDALDLIEFANGDINTTWGKVRAQMGHPAPFNLKMMGVGNENWGPQYIERLKVFTKAIKAKYPNFKLINSSGTDPNGDRFDYLNKELRAMNADFIDEHYYRAPEWFLKNAGRYDSYDRNGSKVFAGEYASHTNNGASASNRNTWRAALSEAAFMTGLERNAAVVQMASYAPLFAHVEGWQWNPDLIWVDNLQSFGTPSYYVQQLYSLNKGTHVLSMTQNNQPLIGQDSLYASASWDKASNEIILKIANNNSQAQVREIQLDGVKKLDPNAKLIVMQSDPNAVNTFEEALKVSPSEKKIVVNAKTKKVSLELAPYSFYVVRIKTL
ncbi:alpha-L-arabinofuranosidase C-terminal domain-containing protein [Flectobacillus rivi]|uniref:non-reducing end alpha-L-arabinofuranosidase n=1 Tax=Flectobacillus rivi TaxID=2984209 RepID=A0ABT6Z8B4_9BACT|nr:alpha-L-arabinofuranosidase C-terminal domain-containing protein [Flectobacillus rivi]MDI9877195.1 alpha-L-arabinofuranosidase C-terminal domain-containing protein [Flectobacillus rivi]